MVFLSLLGLFLVLTLTGMLLWVRMLGSSGAPSPAFLSSGVQLPLREYLPAEDVEKRDTLVVFLTSDVGWLGFNSDLPQALAQRGYHVLSWNSLSYYLRERSPEEAAAALQNLLENYLELWDMDHFAIAGYSWGAGVLPFLVNGLDDSLKEKLTAVAFLAYPGVADFHFHPKAWLLLLDDDELSATEEVAAMPKVPSVCVAGEGDPIRDCRALEPFGVERQLLSAKHSLTPILEEVLPYVLKVLEKGEERQEAGRTEP